MFNENWQRALTKIEEKMARRGVLSDTPPVPPPPPLCDVCRDLGVVRAAVPVGHELFGKLVDCPSVSCKVANERRQQTYAKTLERAGLPAYYKRFTFEHWQRLPDDQRAGKNLAVAAAWMFVATGPGLFSLQQAVAAAAPQLAEKYSPTPKNWLILQGGLGVGKTSLAATIVNELAASGVTALYMRVQEMFQAIQGAYGKDKAETGGISADELLTRVQSAVVLVLDEWNVPSKDGEASADKLRIMEEIVRYRHGRALPTVFTCNAEQEELKRMWGMRTVDVALEAAHWVPVGGMKLRRTADVVRAF